MAQFQFAAILINADSVQEIAGEIWALKRYVLNARYSERLEMFLNNELELKSCTTPDDTIR